MKDILLDILKFIYNNFKFNNLIIVIIYLLLLHILFQIYFYNNLFLYSDSFTYIIFNQL
jgi:hypothetical protein